MLMAEKNILNTILETKQNEVEDLLSRRSLSEWRQLAGSGPVCRDFYKALTKKPQRALNLIAEVKRASPSAGIIREDFDPPAIARQYESGGASAISVLTDSEYFSGSLEYLKSVRESVELPVLRKDFIIDPCQVYESRAAGADAILLIAAALDPDALSGLVQLANSLGMTCLLEVHNSDELHCVI
ncbi:MAG TPA: indole-3-glycerol-phosphate synthase, partial [Phycisphaerae bacterium]|nr:indole-3-glycerol-phosphate synthase [Phycisphaerae bacterium]